MKVDIVTDAPTYMPTEKEWQDPIKYIQEIRIEAENYGICKIIPPKSFKIPVCINRESFKFNTRVQDLREIDAIARVERRFDVSLRLFMEEEGIPLLLDLDLKLPKTKPLYDIIRSSSQYAGNSERMEEKMSLYKLVIAYKAEGGYDASANQKFWNLVARRIFYLPLKPKIQERIQSIFEEYLFIYVNRDSKNPVALEFIAAIRAKLKAKRSFTNTTILKRKLRNSINRCTTFMERKGLERGTRFWKYFPEEQACYEGQLWLKKEDSFLVHYDLCDVFRPLKRVKQNALYQRSQAFHESLSIEDLELYMNTGHTALEAYEAYKYGVCQKCSFGLNASTLVNCYKCETSVHIQCAQPYLAFKPETVWFCNECRADNSDYLIAVSEFGYEEGEAFTLSEYRTVGDMFLKKFYVENEDVINKPKSPREFENLYWELLSVEARKQDSGILKDNHKIYYGSDLDTGTLGSGFPTRGYYDTLKDRLLSLQARLDTNSDREQDEALKEVRRLDSLLKRIEKFIDHPWNLNNFPSANGSLLQHVDSSITGVMVPWLYIGMAFSSFCFHTEDHNFASINYHHFGAPKTWYGVPSKYASLFEEACEDLCPDIFKARNDILTGIVTQYNPKEIMKMSGSKISIYHVLQNPGEFVITFPKAYHGGFNHGLNCAEAVNFATEKWLAYANECVIRYQKFRKQPVIAYESFLITLIEYLLQQSSIDPNIRKLPKYLLVEWNMISKQELRKRSSVLRMYNFKQVLSNRRDSNSIGTSASLLRKVTHNKFKGRTKSSIMNVSYTHGINQCSVCAAYCSLSLLYHVHTKQSFCLDHIPRILQGMENNYQIVYKLSNDDLTGLTNGLKSLTRSR